LLRIVHAGAPRARLLALRAQVRQLDEALRLALRLTEDRRRIG
jgi:hypothetical protein